MLDLPLETVQKETVAEVKLRTMHWAVRHGYIEPVAAKVQSDRAKKVQAIVNAPNMGSQGPGFAALMSILLDEEIVATHKPDQVTFTAGIMVVPMACSNSHNYPMGKPVLNKPSVGYDYFSSVTGEVGNHMGPRRTDVRPATDAEIDAFFAELSKAEIGKAAIELIANPVN